MVEIRNGNFSAKIERRGANCVSLKNSEYGVSVLREPKTYDCWDNPYLYGMPILFPANRISGGSFEFEGRNYSFPINEPKTGCHLHGELHNALFSVDEQADDFVTLSHTVEPTKGFMHKYRVEITYKLIEAGLVQKTKITNLSQNNMPCLLGFHTTFNIPFCKKSRGNNVRILADVGEEIERDKNYLPTGRCLKTDDVGDKLKNGSFDPTSARISRHYPIVDAGRIELFDVFTKIRICYVNDLNFKYRLFYNGNADMFVCLEPQNCIVNAPNFPLGKDVSGFEYIAPNTDKTYVSEILLEKVI